MNPMDGMLFWTLKWMVIITLIIVAIGSIPILIMENFGVPGLIVFVGLIGWGSYQYIRKRLPRRKREF
jgi:hypothetical protein